MPKNKTESLKITVSGVVQGVGFRPFVYRLACKLGLNGFVQNTSSGVNIEIEGKDTSLKHFVAGLTKFAPPMSHIESVKIENVPLEGFCNFEIKVSTALQDEYQLVSPDIATCVDCRKEIFEPGNRRFRYPFTNCTNCGPRFTIIEDMPYDRPGTTMSKFEMCPDCRREYEDPADRRFHAQPNACPVCGPHLELTGRTGRPVKCKDVIAETAALLRSGNIIALKGLGGFQLACDATNEKTVALLRTRKHRPAKPFAVMFTDIADIRKVCRLTKAEVSLLESPQAPIVLLKRLKGSTLLCKSIAPGLKYTGAMLPYTPLHHLLMHETGLPLVMTSGNLSEEPIARDNREALLRLKDIADYFLIHNRDIYSTYDDSVYIVEDQKIQAVRRARGYAPFPVFLPYTSKPVLACGAEEKNTFCLTRDSHAFLSQHIGDMENETTLTSFEKTIDLYIKLFRTQPEAVAVDMHPEYLSSKYGKQFAAAHGLPVIPVQHHHAHIVGCMTENGIQTPVIGVAFDGTGYGTDGTLWGGEFLVADLKTFRRAGHLETVPLPGGAAAIKKPYRMAVSYLYTLLGEDISLDGLPLQKYASREFSLIKQQIKRGINSPLTSGAGRLFDAVSALLGICGEAGYEAEAAVRLETLADGVRYQGAPYHFDLVSQDGLKIIKLSALFRDIIQDIRGNTPNRLIAYKFHITAARMIVEMCDAVAYETGIRNVALSGGVFQNRLLQKLALTGLQKKGYNVLTHHIVPCNDGGISLGQAVVANFNSYPWQ